MFYKKKENGFFRFKSDKDHFWFGPFENNWDFTKLGNNFRNLKTYKNLVWIWQNKYFIFEYNEKIWLNLKEVNSISK